jgi:hypothetical protein
MMTVPLERLRAASVLAEMMIHLLILKTKKIYGSGKILSKKKSFVKL